MDDIAKELIALQDRYATLAIEHWVSLALFTWNWWLLVFLFIFPWLIFFKYYDRERALHLWCIGLIVIIMISFIDDLGSELGAWIYPIKLVPVGLLAYPFDFSIIPVAYMLLYQYFNTWNSFSFALLIQAAIFAFVGEPLSVWLGAVTYLKWNYIYSFVIYIVTGLVSRFLIQRWAKKLV